MIAVTGATGRVGTRLVPLLLEAGEQVRVISRDVERACAMFGGDVETAHGDLDEPDSWRQRSTASIACFCSCPRARSSSHGRPT